MEINKENLVTEIKRRWAQLMDLRWGDIISQLVSSGRVDIVLAIIKRVFLGDIFDSFTLDEMMSTLNEAANTNYKNYIKKPKEFYYALEEDDVSDTLEVVGKDDISWGIGNPVLFSSNYDDLKQCLDELKLLSPEVKFKTADSIEIGTGSSYFGMSQFVPIIVNEYIWYVDVIDLIKLYQWYGTDLFEIIRR